MVIDRPSMDANVTVVFHFLLIPGLNFIPKNQHLSSDIAHDDDSRLGEIFLLNIGLPFNPLKFLNVTPRM